MAKYKVGDALIWRGVRYTVTNISSCCYSLTTNGTDVWCSPIAAIDGTFMAKHKIGESYAFSGLVWTIVSVGFDTYTVCSEGRTELILMESIDAVPEEDWYLPPPPPRCECGGTKSNTPHSAWCPVYRPHK